MVSKEMITITKQEYESFLAYKDEVSYLSHQLAELKRLIFISKRERFILNVEPQQGSLFELTEAEQTERTEEGIIYKRKKAENKRQPLCTERQAFLPRKREIIEPDNIPEDANKIGEAIKEVLDYIPGRLYIRHVARIKYLLESKDEQSKIIIAEMPTLPIPKGNADADLLSYLLVSKFVDHLPFYRLVQIKGLGITITKSTINRWFNATCRLLGPLYEALKSEVLSADYLMADETPLSVQTNDKLRSTHKGYDWVYFAPEKRLVFFDYRKSPGREGPDEILQDFSGFLQTDGYETYTHLGKQPNITLLACMTHARRYFEKAKDNDPKRAEIALQQFQKLYAIERKGSVTELSPEETRCLRHEEALEVLTEMEAWYNEEIYKVLPQIAIGKALAYTLRL